MVSEREYEAMSDRYADPSVPVRGIGPALAGAAASKAGREFLLSEYGSEVALEDALRPGRPRLGQAKTGASPSVRTRLSDADYAAFKELEEKSGRKQSELMREAVHLLLEHHRIAS